MRGQIIWRNFILFRPRKMLHEYSSSTMLSGHCLLLFFSFKIMTTITDAAPAYALQPSHHTMLSKYFLGTCGCHAALMKIRWHATKIVLRFSFVPVFLYFPEKTGVCCVDIAEIEKGVRKSCQIKLFISRQ